MSSEPSSQSEPAAPQPQTLTEFQQQFAATVLANMKASNDAILSAVQQQQARMEAATAELMQRFSWPVQLPPVQLPPTTGGSATQSGGTGQPAAGQSPPAPAGPT